MLPFAKGTNMARWIRRIFFLIIIGAIVGFGVYTKAFRPVHAIGYTVDRNDLVAEVMGTGSIQARVSAVISSKIQGRVVELDVDQGSVVTSGQVIARLDDRDLVRQVEIALANALAKQAGLDRLIADQTRAQVVLGQTQRDLSRIEESFAQGAANESEIDQAKEQVAIAQADVARATAAIAEGRMLLIAAEKTLEYQQARLDDTVISAPFDGLIVRRDRDPGDIIVPGSAIYRLVGLDEIWVSAWVDETAMAKLGPNQPVRIILRSEPDRPYSGRVVRLGRETDSETREFVVDVAIEQLPNHWAIGQRADVYIETNRITDVLVVPMIFLSTADGQLGVYKKVGERAVWTPCVFGAQGREFVEVKSGLEAGYLLVRTADPTGRVGLRDREKVVIP